MLHLCSARAQRLHRALTSSWWHFKEIFIQQPLSTGILLPGFYLWFWVSLQQRHSINVYRLCFRIWILFLWLSLLAHYHWFCFRWCVHVCSRFSLNLNLWGTAGSQDHLNWSIKHAWPYIYINKLQNNEFLSMCWD